MSASIFKKFCEGEMKGKLLYRNGVFDFKHNALPLFTANIMPNIRIDGGVKRRFRGYNHTSLFTTDKTKINESKHIYFVDRDFIENVKKDCLLDAFVDIIVDYGNKWCNGEEIPFPTNFKMATDEMMDVNDHIQDFVDSKLKITTGGKCDRIGKIQMVKLYNILYPKKNISVQQMISLLKPKLKWDKEIRCPKDGTKGCFYNVVENNEYSNNNIFDDNTVETQHNEIKILKSDLERYKKKYNDLKHKQIKKRTTTVEEFDESYDDYSDEQEQQRNFKNDSAYDFGNEVKLLDGNIYSTESDEDITENDLDLMFLVQETNKNKNKIV